MTRAEAAALIADLTEDEKRLSLAFLQAASAGESSASKDGM